jgi:hypothetical protein
MPESLTSALVDLRLATLDNRLIAQCLNTEGIMKESFVTYVCKHSISYQPDPNYHEDIMS